MISLEHEYGYKSPPTKNLARPWDKNDFFRIGSSNDIFIDQKN